MATSVATSVQTTMADTQPRCIQRGYVDVPGGQVHFRLSGDPADIPIVMLHQTASSSVMFEAVMGRMGPRRCLALDTPGFGSSTAISVVSVGAWADALSAALERLGVGEMDLVGHHTGAAVALAIAMSRPDRVRRIALGGPPLLGTETRERIARGAAVIERHPDGRHLLESWQRSAHYAPRGPVELVEREALLLLAAHSPHLAVEAVLDYDVEGAVASLAIPLLAFAGDADPIIEGLAAVARKRPDARIEVIPGAGVHVFDERPMDVADMLAAFFDAGRRTD